MNPERDGYTISSDRGRVDLDVVWGFLRTAYWSVGIERATVVRAIEGSLPFGLYERFGFRPVTAGRFLERPAARLGLNND